jgi:hypothetical protein
MKIVPACRLPVDEHRLDAYPGSVSFGEDLGTLEDEESGFLPGFPLPG